MVETDYYSLLQVERTADAGTIKSAYRKLAMECHPDRNGGCTNAEAKFKALSEAYECLKDPQKRAAYDRFGHAAFRNGGMGGNGGGAQDFGSFAAVRQASLLFLAGGVMTLIDNHISQAHYHHINEIAGILAIIAAVRGVRRHERWGSMLAQGIVGVAAGVIALVWPQIGALALVYLVASWALLTGAFEIVTARLLFMKGKLRTPDVPTEWPTA